MNLTTNTDEKLPAVRIGAVSYLNTKPLIATLENKLGSRSQLSLDLPSLLADQLSDRSLDVGLIPAIEFFRGPKGVGMPGRSTDPYRIISNACIACRGNVRSVRLFFRVPPSRVQSIAIDEGSKTSIALSSILLYERFGIRPQFVPLPITADPNAALSDAVLVIGDRAMHPERYESFSENWDLGNEWCRETGLPFVFAMWVGRQSIATSLLAAQFEEARNEGLENIGRLSEQHASKYGLKIAECIDYLSFNLRFTMNHDEVQGLKCFYQKALSLGLIEQSSPPIWPIVSPLDSRQLVQS